VKGLRRRWWLVGGCVLATAAAALAISLIHTKQYTAVASLLFRDPGFAQELFRTPVVSNTDPAREAATNVRLVSLRAVADQTAQHLPGDLSGAQVASKVAIESDPQSDIVNIAATDPSPAVARHIANTYTSRYVAFRRLADRAKVSQAIDLVRKDYQGLTPAEQQASRGRALANEISKLEALQAVQTGNAEQVQHADLPTSPSSPKTLRNVLLGAIVGLVLGLALAFLAERFDRKLRDPREFEENFGMPVLASIAESKALRQSESGIRELIGSNPAALQMLRTRMRYFNVDREIRSVLVTSSAPGDGKTTIAWNLAASAASAGVKVLLVEADFHRSTLAERVRAEPIPGLSELLSAQSSLERTIQSVPIEDRTNGAGETVALDVIVAGSHPPNAVTLLESTEMARLLKKLRADYEMIVLDTPPVSLVPDAIPLMKHCDGVIVIGRLNGTTRDDATALAEQLRTLNAPVLGVVANRVSPRGRYAGYYGYYEGHPGGRNGGQTGAAESRIGQPG
jgi:polysaccharide biosynthesis transport protein